MQNSIKGIALAALALGIFSCAQETTVPQVVYENRIIDSYVKLHPEWQGKQTESGLYFSVIKEGTGLTPSLTDWVELKMTGETLDGNYFQTTDTTIFQKLEYNLNYFHIVPDFLFMSGAMPQGIREALMKMKEGGQANILMPSYIGFGSYGAVKFGQMPILPNVSVLANYPVKYSLELVKVISKPSEYDSLKVDGYIKKNVGFVDANGKKCVYFKEIVKGSTAVVDTIGEGTTVKVFYAGYFIDKLREGNVPAELVPFNKPYCFDTNIEDVAKGYAPYKPNYSLNSSNALVKSDTLTVVMSKTSRSIVEGFDIALRKMRNGAEGEVVFTSTYGYGTSGSSSSSFKPSIPSYTPLRFYIKVVKVDNSKKTTS